jgi:hypothetical protein
LRGRRHARTSQPDHQIRVRRGGCVLLVTIPNTCEVAWRLEPVPFGGGLMSSTHRLDSSVVHYEWNNAIPPPRGGPGDTIVVDTRDAGDGYYTPTSTSRDGRARSLEGHPLGGPIAVRGAGRRRPGRRDRRDGAGAVRLDHIRRAAGCFRKPSSRSPSSRSGTSRTGRRADARPLRRAWPSPSRRFPGSSGPRSTSRRALQRRRHGRTAGTWISSSSPPAPPSTSRSGSTAGSCRSATATAPRATARSASAPWRCPPA